MKYIIKLNRDEYYLLLGALYYDADRLESLIPGLFDEELRGEAISIAEKERALRSKIIETRKVIG